MSTVIAETPVPETDSVAERKTWRALLPIDSCDYPECTSQSFVRVVHMINDEDLTFCKHHFERVETHFAGDQWEILDERDKINGKNESSA
jgi:hypothetical protein